MRTLLILSVFFAAISSLHAQSISSTKVWDGSEHCAFTDLVDWNDKMVVCFRESDAFVNGKDGTIRLMHSSGGDSWSTLATVEKAGIDLRDPKLSVAPDGRLMLLVGGSSYEGKKLLGRTPMVAYMATGSGAFTDLQPIQLHKGIENPYNALWRVTWHKGWAYGVIYQNNTKPWNLHLVRSKDGRSYDPVAALNHGMKPNETTVRFDDQDNIYAVTRHESGDKNGWLLRNSPYGHWITRPMNIRLGGPDLCQIGDEWILATREYNATGNKTVLGVLDMKSATFTKRVTLPSGGDTSYARILPKGDTVYVSYHSEHEGTGTAVYVAKVPASQLR